MKKAEFNYSKNYFEPTLKNNSKIFKVCEKYSDSKLMVHSSKFIYVVHELIELGYKIEIVK